MSRQTRFLSRQHTRQRQRQTEREKEGAPCPRCNRSVYHTDSTTGRQTERGGFIQMRVCLCDARANRNGQVFGQCGWFSISTEARCVACVLACLMRACSVRAWNRSIWSIVVLRGRLLWLLHRSGEIQRFVRCCMSGWFMSG